MEDYDHKKVEAKWQKRWKDPSTALGTGRGESVFVTDETSGKPKMYILDMFPYPSGSGLHVGHPKGYIATDIYSRYHRMKGYRVLHPMGWDAFGLPAENYAIQNKVHPRAAVEANVKRFKQQLEVIGFDYDWEREINTTDPDYYKWTQWIFLQLFKKGLAYESNEPVNWCPKDKTVLANEDVENGRCERCGTLVERRAMRQWVLKITAYADKLLEGLEELDWPESIKLSQRNWIGKSEGTLIQFELKSQKSKVKTTTQNLKLEVFTTRPDTIFGTTYMVVAPEHPIVASLLQIPNPKSQIPNAAAVIEYVEAAKHKTDLQRQEGEKEKTGVELKGVLAINPANGEKIPVWVADYVLPHYGTGAIMAVPAHDERDFEFAKKFGLETTPVIAPPLNLPLGKGETKEGVYVGAGILINSGEFDGLANEDAKHKMTQWLEKKGAGKMAVNYKLQDWVFSRQRYWGEPIPIIHCENCGTVPVPEEDLPVKLPEVENYEPTGTGESPLAHIDSWVNVACPACAGPARRETNTMPQWAGSSWYYLRYIDPKNDKALVDKKKEKAWMPVDMYVGGAEHATRHLIYARFWHRFFYDEGHVSTPEPFARLQHVGLIAGEDGRKMSKRWGNVINPDDMVAQYGADAFRLYEMFMGPFSQGAAWSTAGIQGTSRFVKRVWKIFNSRVLAFPAPPSGAHETLRARRGAPGAPPASLLTVKLHQTIKRVTESTEHFRFNVAVAAFMELLNEMEKQENVSKETLEMFVKLLSPYAPHIAEELWEKLGHKSLVAQERWPDWDEKVLVATQVSIPVQVNGKVRAVLTVDRGFAQNEIEKLAREDANVAKYLASGDVKKVIYREDKLMNFVVV